MAQQSTSINGEAQQLEQQPVVKIFPLPPQLSRPNFSQSITGPLAGERPPSRTTSVVDQVES